MKKILATTAIALCLSSGVYIHNVFAQETTSSLTTLRDLQQTYNKLAPEAYRQLRQVMLEGSPDELNLMIKEGLNVNGMYRCETPLNMAISSLAYALGSARGFPPENAVEKVKILIKSGANINFEPCAPATTPIITAIQLPLKMYSLEESFNNSINEEIKLDQGHESCLAGAIPKPCKELTVEDKNAIKESIHETYEIARGNLVPYMMDIIKLLEDSGADINITDSQGKTPLHRAALTPQAITLEPLEFLIQKGANVNAQDLNGNTPLFISYSSDNVLAVKLLIDAGADVKIRNNDGLLYNQVVGTLERKYLDKEGTMKQDYTFGIKHGL